MPTRDLQSTPVTGFTLIEVLVTLLVLSIGMLGVASLQMYGTRSGHDAYLRSQAVMLAYDIADRMRANPDGVDAGDYDGVSSAPSPYTDCLANSCSVSQLADYDVAQWYATLAEVWPSATANITVSGSGIDAVRVITISWETRRVGRQVSGASDTETQQFVLPFRSQNLKI